MNCAVNIDAVDPFGYEISIKSIAVAVIDFFFRISRAMNRVSVVLLCKEQVDGCGAHAYSKRCLVPIENSKINSMTFINHGYRRVLFIEFIEFIG